MPQLLRKQIAAMNIHYRLFPLEYFLDTQQELGMKSVELLAQAPHFWVDSENHQDCTEVRKMIEDRGLEIVAFTLDSGMKYQFPICAWDDAVYQKAIPYYINGIKAAGELGARIMPVNCAGGTACQDSRYAFERAVESLRRLAPVAAENGVILAVEPMAKESSVIINTLEELQRLLAAVNHTNVKAALDICTATASYETMEQWFAALGEDIVHIHFTDGKPQGHMVWGQGLHPLDQYIQVLNDNDYQGYLGQNLNVRGMVFDPSEVSDEEGYKGQKFVPDNYWFTPAAASKRNMEAFAPYLAD